MKIAISLLTCSDSKLSIPCINSLLNSDLVNYEYKIFCVDNNSSDNTIDFLNSLKCPLFLIENKFNEGIVLPRIKIMDQILKEEYDYTV